MPYQHSEGLNDVPVSMIVVVSVTVEPSGIWPTTVADGDGAVRTLSAEPPAVTVARTAALFTAGFTMTGPASGFRPVGLGFGVGGCTITGGGCGFTGVGGG